MLELHFGHDRAFVTLDEGSREIKAHIRNFYDASREIQLQSYAPA
jgi:hypothetical protein